MLATVASSTSANRIKRSLNYMDIYSSVIQTPHILTKEGCGYSLRFDDIHIEKVKRTAEELGINLRAFYAERTINGKKKYIKLQGENI